MRQSENFKDLILSYLIFIYLKKKHYQLDMTIMTMITVTFVLLF